MRIENQSLKEFFAELFGTFLFITYGLGAIAENVLFARNDPYFSSFLAISVGFGFGFAIAALIVGKVSGAHLNPAVSFAMLLHNRLTIAKFFVYCLAQFLGAFIAALFVYIVYNNAIFAYEKELTLKTAGIFATFPKPDVSVFGGFFDQFFGTMLLVISVLAFTDKNNLSFAPGMAGFFIGMTIMLIGVCFGYNAGFAINPARDFSPRLLTLIGGWGGEVFTAGEYFFWIPLVAPMIGALFAAFIYPLFISMHL